MKTILHGLPLLIGALILASSRYHSYINLSTNPPWRTQKQIHKQISTIKNSASGALFLIVVFLLSCFLEGKAQTCRPSGAIRGKQPPHGQCNRENDSDHCKQGKLYTTYRCSPPVSSNTKATLTLNSFEKNGDGGAPSECDNQYHSDDDTPVVALSTGWYNHGSRCHKHIRINGNGRSVIAKVVDECDSTMGCDNDHDYQPPCPNNIVDASKAVWEALGVPSDKRGEMDITWSDV